MSSLEDKKNISVFISIFKSYEPIIIGKKSLISDPDPNPVSKFHYEPGP